MIVSVTSQTEAGTHLYCPSHRPNGSSHEPLDLPLRTHEETIQQDYEVLSASTENAASKLVTQYGLKGVALLARVPSVSVPSSFHVEIMHMIWINSVPQLVDLWTGRFHEANTKVQSTYDYEVVSYSSELSKGEVVDVVTIRCVVGRIFDRKEWWIVDRTENL
ncbi:hypothetical protein FRC06_007728, partial [Ceratobasidium sp. 370]